MKKLVLIVLSLCLFNSIPIFAKTLFYDDTTKALGLNYIGTNDNGKINTYYNTLGTNEYEEKYGLIVPTLDNWLYMARATGYTYVNTNGHYEGLTGILMTTDLGMIVCAAEMEVFKLNNPTINFMKCDWTGDYRSLAQKLTFSEWDGHPVWVERDPHAYTVDYMGEEKMPSLQKTIPELSAYCGGTTVAFCGWSNKRLQESSLNNTLRWDGSRISPHNEDGVSSALYHDYLQTGKIYYYMIDNVKENTPVREQLAQLGNYEN